MSRRRRRQQTRLAIMNVVAAAAVIGLAAYAITRVQPPEYDEVTLCLATDELPPHTAIIIDKTDEYSPEQAGYIRDLIDRVGDRLDVGERLTLFELGADGEFNPRGEFSLCNPGRGNQVNALFRNPQQIEERYAERFEGPLEEVLADLIEPKEAPASPILEAVVRLAQTENFSPDAPARRLIIVSDMLQNSDIFTAYGSAELPPAEEIAELIEARYGDELRGVEIEVRLIPRKNRVDQQRGPLRELWEDIFGELGADVRWRDL